MERFIRGLDISKEYLGHIKGIVEDKTFKADLEKAGSVAAMISLGFKLYEQAKERAQTEDEKVFSSLIKFTFECAQETLSNTKDISIRNIESKEIRKNLYDIFVETKEGVVYGSHDSNDPYWHNYYLPSHPTIREFKKLFRELLEAEGHQNLVQKFMYDFGMRIEEKIDHEQNNLIFARWSDFIKRKKKLTEHLQRTSAMIYKYNPIDKKYLAEYYVENNAVVADIFPTWDKEDAYFSEYIGKDSDELRAINVVKKHINERDRYEEEENRYTVVAAPFGIGKTSLATYIASTLASRYLEGEDLDIDEDNGGDDLYRDHIPVFISLKDVNDENGTYIERKLQSISTGKEAKRRKILLVCDGLDEYRYEEIKLKRTLDDLSIEDKYPNIKFLITTRLEAGMQKLHTGLRQYIRLLPFSESQVNEFFTKYGMPQYSFEKISRYGLGDEEKRKPLFCWMIALNPNTERFLQHSVNSRDQSSHSSYLTMALLYQDFIHSLIRAKYKEVSKEFSEYYEYYSDEKNLLRKIAALKHVYESQGYTLTVSKVIESLKDYFGLDYSKVSKERTNIFNLALTSYFYLSGKTTKDKTIDFIHKSFKEHLLAEYYIENMLDHNNKHYLNVGIPSNQTINHLAGLLEIINNEEEIFKEEKEEEQTDNFITALKNKQLQHDKTLKEMLVENATKIFEKDEIVTFAPKIKESDNKKSDEIWWWNTMHVSDTKYRDLWIHRWISLYVLNTLMPKNKIDKKILSNFLTNSSNSTPEYLRLLIYSDLSNADLYQANLSFAKLSNAKGLPISKQEAKERGAIV